MTVHEDVNVVNIVVSRTGGTFGDVDVLVRTIGGGESWTSSAGTDITELLSTRKWSSDVVIGKDYYVLSRRVTFKVSEKYLGTFQLVRYVRCVLNNLGMIRYNRYNVLHLDGEAMSFINFLTSVEFSPNSSQWSKSNSSTSNY